MNYLTIKPTIVLTLIIAFCCCVLPVCAEDISDLNRASDRTIKQVAKQVLELLKETSFSEVGNIAILPFWGESLRNDYIADTVQSHIIDGPYKIMTRDDAVWNDLLSEIKWNTLREDIMNAATIQQFGKIEGCDAIMYGTVRECTTFPRKGMAITRLTLYLADVETGQVLWSSKEIESSEYVPLNIVNRIGRNTALVIAVNAAADAAVANIKTTGPQIKKLAIIPFTGQDEDRYVTEVIQNRFTNIGYDVMPIYVPQGGNTETNRNYVKKKGCDAMMYGSVNTCRVIAEKYQAVVCVNLAIVDVNKGTDIWSPGEIVKIQKLDWWDMARLGVRDVIVWIVGGLIVLFILWRLFKALFLSATRPR